MPKFPKNTSAFKMKSPLLKATLRDKIKTGIKAAWLNRKARDAGGFLSGTKASYKGMIKELK
jgi:hypothetical protein